MFFFKINGETVASMTSQNQILLDDPRPYGMNICHNDLIDVHSINASYCTFQNASFVNVSAINACLRMFPLQIFMPIHE